MEAVEQVNSAGEVWIAEVSEVPDRCSGKTWLYLHRSRARENWLCGRFGLLELNSFKQGLLCDFFIQLD